MLDGPVVSLLYSRSRTTISMMTKRMAAKPYSSSRVKWRFYIAILCLIDKIPRDSQSENKAVEWIVWNKERFSIARAVI